MSRNLLLKFNNYDFSDETLEKVKDYLRTGVLNWGGEELSKTKQLKIKRQYKDFFVNNDYIYYRPLNLKVIPKGEVQEILQKEYDDPVVGLAAGIKSFYNKITLKYLGIKRKDVEEFLKKQQPYQLTRNKPKVINRPHVALYPNHRWAADLIDVKLYEGYNKQRKYILTVIDFFSKKVFAKPLLNAQSESIKNALEEICEENNTFPLILQTDNGSEFKKDVREWCLENNIKQVKTLSHTPTSNGLIENFNNILRKMMRENFIRTNSLNWIDYLDDFIENRNNSKHSTTKQTPNQVWTAGRNQLERITEREQERLNNKITNDTEEIQHKVAYKLEQKRQKDFLRYKADEYNIGDYVRVLNSSLFSKIRKLVKAGKEKLIPIRYSPTIYKISKVLKPRGIRKDFMQRRYKLVDLNDNPLQTELKLNNPNAIRGSKIFFASELQKVDKDTKQIISKREGNKLNDIVDDEDLEEDKQIQKEKREIKKKQPPTPTQLELESRVRETTAGMVDRVKRTDRRKNTQLEGYV